MQFLVDADGLNLRSRPIAASPRNVIAVLRRRQEVTKLSAESDGWWFVETQVQGQKLYGYVASRYLVAEDQAPRRDGSSGQIDAVQMTPKKGALTSTQYRAYPLADPNPLERNDLSDDVKRKDLLAIIHSIDVEENVRYEPRGGSTFCNIYAYDYCYLAGVYLPRVWWGANAIARLASGQEVPPIYGETIFEKNANSLFQWFVQYGQTFGWSRTFSLDSLQDAANTGRVAIISAHRNGQGSGHITAVVPETEQYSAVRRDSHVIKPVESQAGVRNYKFIVRNPWWTSSSGGVQRYDEFGFWHTDQTKDSVDIV